MFAKVISSQSGDVTPTGGCGNGFMPTGGCLHVGCVPGNGYCEWGLYK
jgi:hypothetical protein